MIGHISTRLAPLALCATILCSGCAILNRDNTPTLNLVEKHLVPQSKGARAVAMPLVFPLGVLAVTADAFVVHPATVIDDAADDTQDILWNDWDWDDEYMTECAALPWRALFTPPLFLGDFLGRSFFDIPEVADKQRIRDKASADFHSAKALFDAGKPAEALDVLSKAPINRLQDTERRQAYLLMFRATIASGNLEYLVSLSPRQKISQEDYTAECLPLLQKMQKADDPYTRLHAIRFQIQDQDLRKGPLDLLKAFLTDPSPIVRYEGLGFLRDYQHLGPFAPQRARLLPFIEQSAAQDPDPMVRAFAKEILRTTGPSRTIPPVHMK